MMRRKPSASVWLYEPPASMLAMASSYRLFGLERLTAAARAAPEATAQELCDHLVQEVAAYRSDAPQADDITLLAVRAR